MADLLFVALAVAFFALAGLYVTACDRLIGREPLGGTAAEVEDETERAAR